MKSFADKVKTRGRVSIIENFNYISKDKTTGEDLPQILSKTHSRTYSIDMRYKDGDAAIVSVTIPENSKKNIELTSLSSETNDFIHTFLRSHRATHHVKKYDVDWPALSYISVPREEAIAALEELVAQREDFHVYHPSAKDAKKLTHIPSIDPDLAEAVIASLKGVKWQLTLPFQK